MKLNISQLNTDFWSQGFCILDGLFPSELLKDWKVRVEWLSKYSKSEGVNHINKTFTEANLAARDGVGTYKFTSIDGRSCFDFPGIKEYYHSNSNFLSLLTGLDIVESFDRQSAITFMNYQPPGGQIIPHFDTNFLTFLLYLTDNEGEGATEILPITSLRPTILGHADEVIGESIKIYPKFGRVLLFNGRRCWHSSNPVVKENKISSVWNYYPKDDNFRPADVSKRLYS